ncbi:hypothetical protein B0H14DRAFT_3159355 [Mycena olivaceomarginata]|nr:hypothetical protein B0H14DRAFT_3159355 [Mycena olivaceomarginata]
MCTGHPRVYLERTRACTPQYPTPAGACRGCIRGRRRRRRIRGVRRSGRGRERERIANRFEDEREGFILCLLSTVQSEIYTVPPAPLCGVKHRGIGPAGPQILEKYQLRTVNEPFIGPDRPKIIGASRVVSFVIRPAQAIIESWSLEVLRCESDAKIRPAQAIIESWSLEVEM